MLEKKRRQHDPLDVGKKVLVLAKQLKKKKCSRHAVQKHNRKQTIL